MVAVLLRFGLTFLLCLGAAYMVHGETGAPAIKASDVTGEVGEIVEVEISLEDNPGIVFMQLEVSYDADVLRLTEGGITDTGRISGSAHNHNPLILSWNTLNENKNNGVIAKIAFEILKEADASPVSITYEPGDIRGFDLDKVYFQVKSGSVTAKIHEDRPTISLSNARGGVGDTVDVTVGLKDNPGFAGMRLSIEYDSAELELVGFTDNGKLGQCLEPENFESAPVTVIWTNFLNENITYNGEICVLQFKILKETENSAVTVSYATNDILDMDLDSVHFGIEPGYVSTASGVSVSGLVRTYNPNNATIVELRQGDEVMYTTTIEPESGYDQVTQAFEFTGVAPGAYDLVITKAAHTTFTVKNVAVGEEGLDLSEDLREDLQVMTLICGDLNGDEKVNSTDLNMLWSDANYGKSINAAGVNPLCDLDGSGNINVSDLNILWGDANYGKGEVIIDY